MAVMVNRFLMKLFSSNDNANDRVCRLRFNFNCRVNRSHIIARKLLTLNL